jgi:putative hemolysin
MARKIVFCILGIVFLFAAAACSPQQPTPAANANMANPASVFCEENGGKLDMRPDATGAVQGVCVFPDGSECDEWSYFRGECKPGDVIETPAAEPTVPEPVEPTATEGMLTPTVAVASDGWLVYSNEALGYSFHYPADAILQSENLAESVTIVGPIVNDQNWPVMSFNHSSDPAWRPPEGTDLQQWMVDHYLLSDIRQPDRQIAGMTAIHTRFEGSQQAYAQDSYYFARAGQLYRVVLLHAGKEDWEVYNHFLDSIQFTGS